MISLLIIGNEILSAQVEDSNLRYMLTRLAARGYRVDEVRYVRDEVPAIRDAVRALSARSQFLISSGGVGPTHDDVTLESFAAAFEVALITHPELERRLRDYYGERFTTAHLSHARVPANTELVEFSSWHWPLIKVKNAFVLPGLPEIFVKKFDGVMEVLPPVPKRHYAHLLTSADELLFANPLTALQNQYPMVEIGSYPVYDRSQYAAKVTFKGEDLGKVQLAFEALKAYFVEHDQLVGELQKVESDGGAEG